MAIGLFDDLPDVAPAGKPSGLFDDLPDVGRTNAFADLPPAQSQPEETIGPDRRSLLRRAFDYVYSKTPIAPTALRPEGGMNKAFPLVQAADLAAGNFKVLLPGVDPVTGESTHSQVSPEESKTAPLWAKIAAGAERGVAATAEAVAPWAIAGPVIGAVSKAPLIGRAVHAAFSADILSHLPDVAKSFINAVETGDVQTAVETGVGGTLGAYFGYKAARGATGRREVPVLDARGEPIRDEADNPLMRKVGFAEESPAIRRLLTKQITTEFTPEQIRETYARVNRDEANPAEQELVRFINQAFESPGEAARGGVKVSVAEPRMESQFWRDYLGLKPGETTIELLRGGKKGKTYATPTEQQQGGVPGERLGVNEVGQTEDQAGGRNRVPRPAGQPEPLAPPSPVTPEPAPVVSDFDRYNELTALMKSKPTPEAWLEIEQIKNRNGGATPAAPISSTGATEPNPTDAQIEAGNAPKRKLSVHGLTISIENEAGGIRRSKPGVEPAWQVQMPVAYGYIKGTTDRTKEQIDTYVGPEPQRAHNVYVIDQIDPDTGKYDEPKILLGFPNAAMASRSYIGAFTDGKGSQRIGAITPMTLPEFKEWLKSGDTTKAVAYKQKGVIPSGKKEEVQKEGDILTPPAAVTVPPANLPPVKPGFVRMYHGGADPRGQLNGDRDVTMYFDYAKGYADKNKYNVWYIDVPEGSPFMKMDEGASMPGKKKYWINTVAPAEVMQTAKPVFPEAKPPVRSIRPKPSGTKVTTPPAGTGTQNPLVDPIGNPESFYSPSSLKGMQMRRDPRLATALKYYAAKNTKQLSNLAAKRFADMKSKGEQPTAPGQGDPKTAERLRQLSAGMNNAIAEKRRSMTQNPTPKRNREYRSRLHDADNMERVQRALLVLADAHANGTVPTILADVRSKADIHSLVYKGLEGGGYYDVIPSRDYANKTPKAKALQELMDRKPETPEQKTVREERERKEKINQLEESVRFSAIPGFFPTPKPLADEMVSRAGIKPGQSVLEPSAGKGDLADAVKAAQPAAKITTVERMNTLREILKAKGYSVVGEDFMEHQGQYDRIVMNPPFERGQDIEHVRHAYDLLKPGGKLVALMSEGSFSRGDKKATEFREWLESIDGISEKSKEGSFKGVQAFRQTGAGSRIVEIEKAGVPETKPEQLDASARGSASLTGEPLQPDANAPEGKSHDAGLAESAAGFLRRNVGADPGLAEGADGRRRQADLLAKWATENGALLTAAPKSYGAELSSSTSEHYVVGDDKQQLVFKWTWPATSGQKAVVKDGGMDRAPASPLDYLERIQLQNQIFGDDIKVIGFQLFKDAELRRWLAGLSIVTSQPFRKAAEPANPNPTRDEIWDYLTELGFYPDASGFEMGAWKRKDGALIIDARPDNFVKTPSGIMPIDLQMGFEPPTGAASLAKSGNIPAQLEAPGAQQVVEAWHQENPTAPDVDIVTRPKWTQAGSDGQQYGVRGWWDGQRIVVNLAFLPDDVSLRAVLDHELIHPLLDAPEGQKAIDSAIGAELGKDELDQLRKRYKQGDGESEDQYRRRIYSEWFARLKERSLSAWQRIIAAIRQFLAKLKLVKLTDDEVGRSIIRALEKDARQADTVRGGSPALTTQNIGGEGAHFLAQLSESGFAESPPRGVAVRDAWERAIAAGENGRLPVARLAKDINAVDVTFDPKGRSVTFHVSGYGTGRGADTAVKFETVTVTVTDEGALRMFATVGGEPRLQKFAIEKALEIFQGKAPNQRESDQNLIGFSEKSAASLTDEPVGGAEDISDEIERAIADAEGVPTQAFGRKDTVAGRGRLNRQAGALFAKQVFQTANLDVVQQDNGLWQLADPMSPQEGQGLALLAALRSEIGTQQESDRPETGALGNLLNSVVENLTQDDLLAFSPELKRELYAVAQGERSHRGVMLAAIAGFSKTVQYVARHVDVLLQRTYSDEFGGREIAKSVKAGLDDFKGQFTDEDLENALKGAPQFADLLNRMSGGNALEFLRRVFELPFSQRAELRRNAERLAVETLHVTKELAATLGKEFEKTFDTMFDRATTHAIGVMEKMLSMSERRRLRVGKRSGPWTAIVAAVKAGKFDAGYVLARIAKAGGWTVPTESEIEKVRQLAEQIDLLRAIPAPRAAALQGNPTALQREMVMTRAANAERIVALKRQIETYWAKWTRPFSLRSAKGRANMVEGGYEFTAANLLFKTGFLTRQTIDVLTQVVAHIPNRSIANALAQHGGFRGVANPEFWLDAGNIMAIAARTQMQAMAPALREFKEAMKGTAEVKNVDRLLSGIALFERVQLRADELAKQGKFAQAFTLRVFGLIRFSYRFASAMDNLQGVPQEWQEIRTEAYRHFREAGMSPAEAKIEVEKIVPDLRGEFQRALVEAQRILEVNGTPTRAELEGAAWHIVKGMAYQRMKEAGMPADEFEQKNRLMRSTNAWNESMSGVSSPGGIAAIVMKKVGEWGKNFPPAAIVTGAFGRFGNAIGTGIDRTFMWTPAGYFPGFFGVRQDYIDPETGVAFRGSPWLHTREDRAQRSVEALVGSMIGALMIALVLAGLIVVRSRWPRDKEERDIWDANGWKPGTAAIQLGDGKELVVSTTVGPMALVRPALAGAGALVDALKARQKQQETLNARAAKLGLPPGEVKGLDIADMLAIAGETAWASALGGRTAGGLIGSLTDYGVPNASKSVAATLSPYLPGLPGIQEASRMAGVTLDNRLATVVDFMVPLPTSKAAKVNMLGDQAGNPNDLQRIVQILTGGTYPMITDAEAGKSREAYAALFGTGFRPPSIDPNKGYAFADAYRPMSDGELDRYSKARGQYFKAELAGIGPDADVKAVRAAFQRANQRALGEIGVSPATSGVQSSQGVSARAQGGGTAGLTPSAPRFGFRGPSGRSLRPRRGRSIGRRSLRLSRGPGLRAARSLRLPQNRFGRRQRALVNRFK